MIDSIHQSSLGMALRCGEQFRRRYLENHIIPPSIAAARGTGVHKANHVNLTEKIKTGEDMPLSDLQDAARDGYVHAMNNGVFISPDEISEKERLINEGFNDTQRCVGIYRVDVAPKIKPKAVEEEFQIDVGLDLPIAGRMDYQEEPVVGDIKTTSRRWPEGRIRQEIQPVFYSFAHEHETKIRPQFIYHILIASRGKDGPTSEKLQEQDMTPTDNDYRSLFAKLRIFIEMLKTGTFPPANPTAWWCDKKWCGYWQTCPYVGNAPKTNWI